MPFGQKFEFSWYCAASQKKFENHWSKWWGIVADFDTSLKWNMKFQNFRFESYTKLHIGYLYEFFFFCKHEKADETNLISLKNWSRINQLIYAVILMECTEELLNIWESTVQIRSKLNSQFFHLFFLLFVTMRVR